MSQSTDPRSDTWHAPGAVSMTDQHEYEQPAGFSTPGAQPTRPVFHSPDASGAPTAPPPAAPAASAPPASAPSNNVFGAPYQPPYQTPYASTYPATGPYPAPADGSGSHHGNSSRHRRWLYGVAAYLGAA